MHPAARLLFDLVSPKPGFPTDDLGIGSFNWKGLVLKAAELRLAPLLTCRLRSNRLLGLVPSVLRKNLVSEANRNLGHNIACANLTSRIVDLLKTERIETVLLKGIAHIHDCYPEFEGRVFRDIDLLVRKEHLTRAAQCMEYAGFYQEQPERLPPQHHHLAPFLSNEGQSVEIHWNLVHPLSPVQIKEDELWAHVRPCDALPGSFLLHPVDSLIHTSVHLMISSDITGQVYQLVDVDRLIKTHFGAPDIFARLVDRAAQFGCEIPVCRTLHLAHEFLGTPMPSRIFQNLGHNRFPSRIMHHLTASTLAGPTEVMSSWRYEMYRNLLNYRKLLLRMNSKSLRIRYVLSRPGAMLKDSIKLLRNSNALW